MDRAKYITDTPEVLLMEYSGKQASVLRRSFFERSNGAAWNENLGVSKIRLS
jgi:hypothetical protein